MKKVITYGTYDLLHYGHIALLKRAKQLGDYLIVGVTSDAFDKNRGKLNVQQSVVERIEAVKSTGLADEIIVEEYEGQKISDIKRFNIDIFAIGSDWLGKFDYLNEYCEVVYLKRTDGVSSTELRSRINPEIKVGIIGVDNPVERIIKESFFVSGMKFCGIYDENKEKAKELCSRYEMFRFSTFEEMLENVDAIYLNKLVTDHAKLIRKALDFNCHVLCESPMFISTEDASRLFEYAKSRQLVLFEAIKTLYFPGFEHLMLIVNSGLIGSIRDIEVACSHIPENIQQVRDEKYKGCMYDWGSIALSPIVKILGVEYESCTLFNYEKDKFNYFVRGILKYKSAVATFRIGKGIKTEGHMVITGTNGYIYVPAPWWKTDYFEIRYEDLRDSKKYFYQYAGEGFRYELLEFVKMIQHNISENCLYPKEEIMCVTSILEQFENKDVQVLM